MQSVSFAEEEFIENESYDISIDISECREYVVGYCENCKKEYKWINIFTFFHVEDIKEYRGVS